MLKKQEILDYVSQNEGISTLNVIERFRKKHDIKVDSIKNKLYRLKKSDFLTEKSNKLYSKNPFDKILKEILESPNSYILYQKLAEMNDIILSVLKDISPASEKRLRKMLDESLDKSYRFTSDRGIK